MTNFVSQSIAAVVQTAVILLIPFVWWLVTARKKQGFFSWLGWTRPKVDRPGLMALIIVGTVAVGFVIGQVFVQSLGEVAPSPLAGLGFAGLAASLVFALLQTAFAEESLFRGFILKRVANRFGYWTGNLVQAGLFGLMHMVPLLAMGMNPLLSVGTGLYSGILGLIMGALNERMGNGSLVPGWLLHALANVVSGLFTLFVLG